MKYIKWFIKAAVAGVLSLAISSVFCFFYYNPGSHITSQTGATDYVWIPNKITYRSTEGFGRATPDENGYFNTYGVNDENINILLMGSSHMEAGNVKEDENTAYLINKNLNKHGLSLYNIGISGHDFLRCIKNMPSAINCFEPSDYVVVETSSVCFNSSDIDLLISGEMDCLSSHDSGLLFELQKITVFKLLYSQVEGAIKNFFKQFEPKAEINKTNINVEQQSDLNSESDCNTLLKYASDIAKAENVKLIVFYHPTFELNKNGTVSTSVEGKSVEEFATACKNNDIIFVDMTDDFYKMYETEYVLPHGFSNTSPAEGHLNKHGHKAIADRISKTILQLEEEKQ